MLKIGVRGSGLVNNNQSRINERDEVVRLEDWILFILMGIIPVLNLFALGYFSFNSKVNANKRNFSRAALIYISVIYTLMIIAFFI